MTLTNAVDTEFETITIGANLTGLGLTLDTTTSNRFVRLMTCEIVHTTFKLYYWSIGCGSNYILGGTILGGMYVHINYRPML